MRRTYHADGMLLYCDAVDRPVLAAVLEGRRGWDPSKRWTWKLYVAQLEAELTVNAARETFMSTTIGSEYRSELLREVDARGDDRGEARGARAGRCLRCSTPAALRCLRPFASRSSPAPTWPSSTPGCAAPSLRPPPRTSSIRRPPQPSNVDRKPAEAQESSQQRQRIGRCLTPRWNVERRKAGWPAYSISDVRARISAKSAFI